MRQTAARAAVAALVIGGVVVLALALWKLKVLIALLFFAFIISAAMRPSVDWLARRRVPRAASILLHYLALIGIIAGLLWAVVPRALDQVQTAIGDLPSTRAELREQARESEGIKHRLLVGIEERLEQLPAPGELVDTGAELTLVAVEVFVGIFFVLACAAYWIYERNRAVNLVTSMLPRPKRKRVRDTWDLIDMKLGAYVRGQALLIALVATVLAICFWAIGLPFWLLLAVFAGIVELVPVIGPLAAGALAVGVGLTVSWQVALAAGIAVLVVRLIEDYLVIPRVLGDAVGLSPLVVLVAVTGSAILFGEWAVLLAIPLAAVVATLIDVVVLDKDPAEEEVPTVLFAAKEAETTGV
ncbi:MAG TPA: AI-2E family transporter [Gaiellaceae bacterium]|jgi:predicted PurR-regulated permease PerM|nr:AI-2E family transporter [Gaiellaceae bacterium]